MKHIIFFIFLFSMNVNCIHDDPLQDGDSRIVWKSKFINMENASPSKFDPIIDDKKIYISRWDGEKNNAIISFDKLNGGVDWTWKGTRIKNTGKEVQYTIYSLIKYENILVGSDKKNLVGIDSETGQTVWEREFSTELLTEKLHNNTLYHRSINFDESELSIYAIDPLTGLDNNKYVIESQFDDYEIFNYGFNVYENSNSETCIILGMFYAKDYYKSTEVKKYGLINYNLDKNEYVFNQ